MADLQETFYSQKKPSLSLHLFTAFSDFYCDKANDISAKIYASIIKHTHLQKCSKKIRLLLGCAAHLKQKMKW